MNVSSDFVALLMLGAALFPVLLCAQEPASTRRATATPELEPLLAKIAAQRGPAKAGADTTIAFTGTFEVSFVSEPGKPPEIAAKGAFRELFVGDRLARCTTDMGPFGAMEKGLHADRVWEVDPHMGARLQRGVNAAAARRYFAMLRGDDPRAMYRQIERAGSERVDGRELLTLRMTPDEGKPDTWTVEGDGTVVRIDTALAPPESADAAFGMDDLMPARLTFADWRQVEGGRFPAQRELAMGPATVRTTCTSMVVGGAIEPAKFEPPAAVQKLALAPVQPARDAAGKPTYQIVERTAQPVASIRTKVAAARIADELAILLPEVNTYLQSIGATPAGAPFVRYHAVTTTEVELEAGIPVRAAVPGKGRIQSAELPAGRAVTAWHIGPYDRLDAARAALEAHVTTARLRPRGAPWAVFWTDPGMVPDSAKWRTQLFAPIE